MATPSRSESTNQTNGDARTFLNNSRRQVSTEIKNTHSSPLIAPVVTFRSTIWEINYNWPCFDMNGNSNHKKIVELILHFDTQSRSVSFTAGSLRLLNTSEVDRKRTIFFSDLHINFRPSSWQEIHEAMMVDEATSCVEAMLDDPPVNYSPCQSSILLIGPFFS